MRIETIPRSGKVTESVMPFFRFVMGPLSWRTSKGIAWATLRRKTSRSAPARWKLPSMSAQ